MERSVKTYKSQEIDEEKLMRIKKIAASRCSEEIYNTYYKQINLTELQKALQKNGFISLGEDWFLFYEIYDEEVIFGGWVATDNKKNKIKQVSEMLNTFKTIFIKYKDKTFYASCRHDSSYRFYETMLQKGYLKHYYDIIEMDVDIAPPAIQPLNDFPPMLQHFLHIKEVRENPEYLKYFLHDLEFTVTDKFIDKYSKKPKVKR